jgi:membrane-bound metal-dependent hydrolase YbcI (DUF457 family)
MPQPGLHAVLALATRNGFSRQQGFALGLTFGALLPDADGYPQAAAIIIGRMDPVEAEAIFHRTLTHSLFFAVAVGVVFYILSVLYRSRPLRIFGWGLATGIAVIHIFVDIFAWFDGVGILWPLWSINLWSWLALPAIITNLLRAGNFLAFAAFFAYLAVLARQAKTNTGYLPRLRLYTYIQLGLGLLFTGLAFIMPATAYNIADGTLFLFWAYPNALWVTWRMQNTIAAA